MQFTNIIISAFLATAVVAKGGNKTTKAVTDASTCKEMASLSKMVSLAANETKLAAKTKNNATKIADFQSKASAAAAQLSTMESNTTLVATCAVYQAAAQTSGDCQQMDSLNQLVKLAANQTKLAEKTKNNATKIAAFQSKASEASTKLDSMMSNTTLMTACDAIKTAKSAKKNGTSVEQAAAAAASSSASATSTAKSAAGILSAQTGILSTFILVAAGMVML